MKITYIYSIKLKIIKAGETRKWDRILARWFVADMFLCLYMWCSAHSVSGATRKIYNGVTYIHHIGYLPKGKMPNIARTNCIAMNTIMVSMTAVIGAAERAAK